MSMLRRGMQVARLPSLARARGPISPPAAPLARGVAGPDSPACDAALVELERKQQADWPAADDAHRMGWRLARQFRRRDEGIRLEGRPAHGAILTARPASVSRRRLQRLRM